MINAEAYLNKKLRGIKLHANTHKFIVEILTSYLADGLEQQRYKYEYRIQTLQREIEKRSYKSKSKTTV